jgi:hypothetical protein
MTDNYTYSFGCPACGGSWTFEQFASIAKDVFSSWDGEGECPVCGRRFVWRKPGELNNKPASAEWHKTLRKRYPKRCGNHKCQKAINGRRKKYCSVDCKNAAYYQRNKDRILKQQKDYRRQKGV